MKDAKELAHEIVMGWFKSGQSVDQYPFERALADAITQARADAFEEAAKIAEAFVHTRTDCEAGTTTEDIAKNIRSKAKELSK